MRSATAGETDGEVPVRTSSSLWVGLAEMQSDIFADINRRIYDNIEVIVRESNALENTGTPTTFLEGFRGLAMIFGWYGCSRTCAELLLRSVARVPSQSELCRGLSGRGFNHSLEQWFNEWL